MSDSLWPHGLQHARLLCPPLSPGVCVNSCPLSRWCYPAISSSVVPFSSCPQSLPASGSFPVSQLFISQPQYWSFSISPSNEHPGLISFRMDWLDFLAVQETLKSLLQHHSSKASILWCSAFFIVQLFTWGGQSTGVSALASFPPKKSQGWSPSEWTGWISLQSKGLSRVFSNTVQKYQFFGAQLSSQSNSHICIWLLEKS